MEMEPHLECSDTERGSLREHSAEEGEGTSWVPGSSDDSSSVGSNNEQKGENGTQGGINLEDKLRDYE